MDAVAMVEGCASGVLIEFDGPGRPIVVDRTLYRELVKGAIKRPDDDVESKAATAAQEVRAREQGAGGPGERARRNRRPRAVRRARRREPLGRLW